MQFFNDVWSSADGVTWTVRTRAREREREGGRGRGRGREREREKSEALSPGRCARARARVRACAFRSCGRLALLSGKDRVRACVRACVRSVNDARSRNGGVCYKVRERRIYIYIDR